MKALALATVLACVAACNAGDGGTTSAVAATCTPEGAAEAEACAGKPAGSDSGSQAGADDTSDSGSRSQAGVDASIDPGSSPAAGSSGDAASSPVSEPAPDVVGAATLVQHVSGSNLRGSKMASPFCYFIELPAPATAGNAIVVGATWKGSATLSVTDDQKDKYTNREVFDDTTDSQSVGIATAFGVTAGARDLSVCFSSDPGGWVEPMATELAGIVGIDGAGSAAKGVGATATAGSLKPSATDLLYQVVYTPGGSPHSFTAGEGSHLLSADILDGWAGQYGPATAGAPSISLGSSVHWATAAVLLQTGKAGKVPSGMRIVRLQHENMPVSATAGGNDNYYPTPVALEFPSSGNLIVAPIAGGSGTSSPASVTKITDGNGNHWIDAKTTTYGDALSQIFYAASATTGASLPISVTWNQSQTDDSTAMLYDITGAATSPFDTAAGGTGAMNAVGNLTLPFTVTPAQIGELVFVATPWDFGTAGGLIGGLLDENTTSGESESGPFPIDENNGWGHAVSTSTKPMSFTWTPLFPQVEFGGYAAVAAAFKPAP